MFTVQLDVEEYRIVGPGGDDEEGDAVEYGELATLKIGEAIYYCLLEDPNADTPVVYRVDRVSAMPTINEEVVFEDVDDEPAGGPMLVTAETDTEDVPEE